MTALSADDLTALAEALRLLTAATKQTGIRFDGPGSFDITAPSGDYVTVRWTDDSDGQYLLAPTQY